MRGNCLVMWLAASGVVPLVGCADRPTSELAHAPAGGGPGRDGASPIEAPGGASAPNGSSHHDFGTLLSEGQTLEHGFRIANTSGRPIKIHKAITKMPCCTTIGPLPEVIPVGGSVEIPTTLKVKQATELKRVEFLVWTDSPDRPVRRLVLSARLLSRGELDQVGPGADAAATGGRGASKWTAIKRWKDSGRRAGPIEVEISPPARAAFVGPGREESLPGGLIQCTRDIEVVLPESRPTGTQQATLAVRCEDDSSLQSSITWKAGEPIKAVPSGFTVAMAQGVTSRTIVLHSSGRPFKITGIENPLGRGPVDPGEGEPKASHRLEVTLDPARMMGRTSLDIVISTDNDEQPRVLVTILSLDRDAGGAR